MGGHGVYGAYFEGGMGYRCDSRWGVASGNEPESMYMVTAGNHFNGGCCFDCARAALDPGTCRLPLPLPRSLPRGP